MKCCVCQAVFVLSAALTGCPGFVHASSGSQLYAWVVLSGGHWVQSRSSGECLPELSSLGFRGYLASGVLSPKESRPWAFH
jgi:hypothetical protein